MDRDQHLRLVRGNGVSVHQPERQAEEKPPEHASPEAMLRWARAARGVNQSREEPVSERVPRLVARPEEFAGRVFPDAEARIAAVLAPESAMGRSGRRSSFIAALLGGAAAIGVVAVTFAYPDRSLSVPAGANADQAGDASPGGVSPDQQAPDAFMAELAGLPGPRLAAEPLPQIGQGPMAVPKDIVPAGPGIVEVAAMNNPEAQPAAGVIVPEPEVGGPLISPVRIISADLRPELAFAEPQPFTRDDLKTGFTQLLTLMSGEDLAGVDKTAAADKFANLPGPVIYVRHGLGASPEKVRAVMQSLTNAGYQRVFRVAVPYRIGRTNVRFYHGHDGALAGQIADSILPLIEGPRFTAPRDFSGFSDLPEEGTIEVWLSDKA